jgi:hypothetical protein
MLLLSITLGVASVQGIYPVPPVHERHHITLAEEIILIVIAGGLLACCITACAIEIWCPYPTTYRERIKQKIRRKKCSPTIDAENLMTESDKELTADSDRYLPRALAK